MIDAPEHPHQHPAHTGHRWLDITLALSAMFVSVVSLVVAVEHGRTMERMADANSRMVEASSWPFVEFDTHDIDEQGKPEIRFVLTNAGIGPARIQTFELSFDGKPMSSLWSLLEACCATSPAHPDNWKQMQTARATIGVTAPNILRAGDHEDFFTIVPDRSDADLVDKLDAQREKITARTCYCSVFDECWISSGLATHADRVASCPTPAIPFRTDVRAPKVP
jgi:hypothetical protein